MDRVVPQRIRRLKTSLDEPLTVIPTIRGPGATFDDQLNLLRFVSVVFERADALEGLLVGVEAQAEGAGGGRFARDVALGHHDFRRTVHALAWARVWFCQDGDRRDAGVGADVFHAERFFEEFVLLKSSCERQFTVEDPVLLDGGKLVLGAGEGGSSVVADPLPSNQRIASASAQDLLDEF